MINPIQAKVISSVNDSLSTKLETAESPAETGFIKQTGSDDSGQIPTQITELRQAHPWLNPAQLGNLLLNQSNQQASQQQIQALRPSFSGDYFKRHMIV